MNKKALYGLLIAVFLPLISYFLVKTYTKDNVLVPRHYIYDSVTNKTVNGKSIEDTAWHRLPDFKLKNQLNQDVGWDDLEGKVVIADFFFTHCPTICPKLTQNMKMLQDNIRSAEKVGDRQARFIHFLSFTVDPERDSVPALKRWADRFQINPENWWLLTGPKKEIYDLSINDMKMGLVDGQGVDTGFFHTDYMVLIDKYRTIRGYYHGLDSASVAKLSRDIIFLSLEKDPKNKSVFSGQLELVAIVFLITIVGIFLLVFLLKKFK